MKKFYTTALLMVPAFLIFAQETPKNDTTLMAPVEVTALKAADKTPVAKSNLTREDIQKQNTGRDLPFIINQTPSVVINSDAGNGIGYTGIRIRGTDASRINVTLNSIPYNDAESQGTFFVDIPDFASSANTIQIQRGVGTSTNGAGSFGGTVNISTNEIERNQVIEVNNSLGSYNSMKNTFVYHSGILNNHWLFDGRLSNISSDGYIDRAFSQLRSLHFSSAYVKEKLSVRMNIFSGKEKTYQAWNGIDEQTLKTNRTFNSAGTEKPNEPYANETDNYTQTHYQLFVNNKINYKWKWSLAGFFTKGRGYYEQYKADQAFANYNLPDYTDGTEVVETTDLVRQLWLDNNFYGNVFSLVFSENNSNVNIGGGWNHYDGKHFGKIVLMQFPVDLSNDFRWYDLAASKKDYSGYTKWTQGITKKWETYLDLQVRYVSYKIGGFRNNPLLSVSNNYTFFNPKAGITFSHKNLQAFAFYSRASKEPNRDDFEAGQTSQPKPEFLNDFEAGLSWKSKKSRLQLNLFYMDYKNQLILTGQINDVGAYTRTNVNSSYRAGVELETSWMPSGKFQVNFNIALSENKVKNFTEFIDDYDEGGQKTNSYSKADLAFSPAVVSFVSLVYKPAEKADITFNSKYVSRQYLDNTSQRSRSLNSYLVHDARFSYRIIETGKRKVEAFVNIYNIFSKKYEPNGYTFSYIYDQSLITENYYYPMAPVNFMAGLNMTF